jgi:hypothetical protein
MMNHVQTLWLEWIGMVDQTANDAPNVAGFVNSDVRRTISTNRQWFFPCSLHPLGDNATLTPTITIIVVLDSHAPESLGGHCPKPRFFGVDISKECTPKNVSFLPQD